MRWAMACAAGLLFVALTAEAGARYEGFGKPLVYRTGGDGYELVPNQQVSRMGHISTVNNIGTRGDNVSLLPGADTFRVIVLGDSVSNGGTMLDDDQVFSAVASRGLEARGCRNETINVSAGGWSLFDEVSWVQRHGLFGARLVVWTVNYMDLDQPPTGPSVLDSNPSFPSAPPPFATWEITTRYLLPRVGLSKSAADTGSSGAEAFDVARAEQVLAEVRSFKAYLDHEGVQLMVLYHEGREPLAPARRAAAERFQQQLSALGVKTLRDGLSLRFGPSSQFIDAIHPNASGHDVIGKSLAETLMPVCRPTS